MTGWVDACQRRAAWVVLAALVLVALSVGYLVHNLRIDTDTENMLSASLPFRQNDIAIDRAFPSLQGRMLIVVEAPDTDGADEAARRLSTRLRADPKLFQDVLSDAADPFLDREGLLYLPTEKLNELAARLSEAQPFLGTLWQHPNLAGLRDMTGLIARGSGMEADSLGAAAKVLNRMADVAEKTGDGELARLSWAEVLMPGATGEAVETVRRLITVRPTLDYATLHPAARAEREIRKIVDEEGLEAGGVRVRLTGGAALESEELSSVENGMAAAGITSMILVAVILILGLRSAGAIVSLLLTLVAGLIWTAAFAILALGSLNLISVAFAVLFVGLSVDFGIHVYLRAVEFADRVDWRRAIVHGAADAAPSLALCAVTSAIGFFSFLPTAYVGLAELGLIAGVGMLVALICNMTLLPALLRLMVRRPPAIVRRDDMPHPDPKRARLIVAVVAVLGLASVWLATESRFDFDPMNLRDPDGPAMTTFRDVTDAGLIQPYAAEVLLPDYRESATLAKELESLPEVDTVRTVDDLIPDDQEEKRQVIEDLAFFIGPSLMAQPGTVMMDERALKSAAAGLRENLLGLAALPTVGPAAERLLTALPEDLSTDALARINSALFATLPMRLERLTTLLEAEPIALENLPSVLKSRFVAADGRGRIEIEPAGDARDPENLEAFVAAVQSVAPHATGAPVIIVEAGRAVLAAFAQALAISVALIAVVIFIVVRNVVSLALVFAPVVVAAVWTLAVAALADIPFNFANVIVLPLLFGLSVDFGVHLVMRARSEAGAEAAGRPLRATTTPRAVLLSALTTIGSFGAIVLSGHPGTASMGLLLTISVSLTLIAILVFLPALMTLVHGRR